MSFINIKKTFILSSALLCGCFHDPTKNIEPNQVNPPAHIKLQNTSGVSIGNAIQIRPTIFVTTDHILDDKDDLFIEEQEIIILARDFEHDLLVFSLQTPISQNFLQLSKTLPTANMEIFWNQESQLHSGSIISQDTELKIGNETKKNLLTFSGVVTYGSSGLPIFDKSGKTWGMIVGGDTTLNRSYAIPTEWIMKFIAENIDEESEYD